MARTDGSARSAIAATFQIRAPPPAAPRRYTQCSARRRGPSTHFDALLRPLPPIRTRIRHPPEIARPRPRRTDPRTRDRRVRPGCPDTGRPRPGRHDRLRFGSQHDRAGHDGAGDDRRRSRRCRHRPPEQPTTTAVPDSVPETTVVTAAPAVTSAPAPAQAHITVQSGQVAHDPGDDPLHGITGQLHDAPEPGQRLRCLPVHRRRRGTDYGGYSHAYLAPPWVQDERAAIDVNRFLAQWHNDVSMIPVMWYYPRAGDRPRVDGRRARAVRRQRVDDPRVPAALAGGVLVHLRQAASAAPLTQADVLARARGSRPRSSCGRPTDGLGQRSRSRCSDRAGSRPRTANSPTPSPSGLCSETAPGIVFGVKLQPVLAVHDGVVTAVDDAPGAPISVTVTDVSVAATRCRGSTTTTPARTTARRRRTSDSASLAKVGGSVKAGQILGFMGDSDPLPLDVRADVPTDATVRSLAPRRRRAPHPADDRRTRRHAPRRVRPRHRRAVPPGLFGRDRSVDRAASTRLGGARLAGATIETTDDDREIDSRVDHHRAPAR